MMELVEVDVEEPAEVGRETDDKTLDVDADGKDEVDEWESVITLIALWISPKPERESGGQRTPGDGVSCPSAKRERSCKIESFGESPASSSKANSRRSIKARNASVCEIAQIVSGVSVELSSMGVVEESEVINFLNTLSSAT